MNLLKRVYWPLAITLLVFGVIYALITFVNHYYFRTYALDLGVFTNALYSNINGEQYWGDVTRDVPRNMLSIHFNPILFVLAPLMFVFGQYTLLLIQLVSALFGGWGVFRYLQTVGLTKRLSMFGVLHFMSSFGVICAIAFDYHSNVLAAMLVPWLLLNLQKQRFGYAAGLLLLMLMTKESVAMWLIFVTLGYALLVRKSAPRAARQALALTGISAVWFVLVYTVVMPALMPTGHSPDFEYAVLGGNLKEAVVTLLTKPQQWIPLLFTNPMGVEHGDYVKAEVWIYIALFGGVLLLRKPAWLLMFIPLFAQKMFHNRVSIWGISSHYTVEFIPLITMGVFTMLAAIKNVRWQTVAAIALVGVSIALTHRMMDGPYAWQDRSAVRFYHEGHWTRDYDVAGVHELLETIPENAPVSALSPFVPHLAMRDDIYMYPKVKNAEYVLLSADENPYPMTDRQITEAIQRYADAPEWVLVQQVDSTCLFRKQ